MRALIDGGVKSLIGYAENRGLAIDTSDCYTACSVCRKIADALNAYRTA